MRVVTFTTELAHIRGINKRLLSGLKKLNIVTVRDLLLHMPFRYDDFSSIARIEDVVVGQIVTIHGKIIKITMRRAWRRNLMIIEATIADETGVIRAVWFNQPYLMQTLTPGTAGNFAGKVTFTNDSLCLSNPVFESSYADTTHTAGLIPIYPETSGLTSRGIRYLIKPILHHVQPIPECIPAPVVRAAHLPTFMDALRAIHFPKNLEEADAARRRIAFEDLFLLQLTHCDAKLRMMRAQASVISWTEAERDALIAALPFPLTASQKQSLNEILNDCRAAHPMNRLLQGDVGSGKTVVAAITAILAARHGFQTAILAPTEVLARQHYCTFIQLFKKIINDWQLNLALTMSAEARIFCGDDLETAVPKARLVAQINEGRALITIGTHALIQKTVLFSNLGLIIIDEQHRFGVEQRAALMKKNIHEVRGVLSTDKHNSGIIPHFLSMSATPIPRTLFLTLFGDLNISLITEPPLGREPVITKIVAPANRSKAYAFIREEIKRGRQAFVICPRIEVGGEKLRRELPIVNDQPQTPHMWDDVTAVTEEYEKLSKHIFPDISVGAIHGKIKNAEKKRVMHDFAENRISILVATSVVEVGVDVPNATIMMIEDADRFGLAQLYQFRGRVGRGTKQSVCLLFTKHASGVSYRRLQSLLEAKNGFELAEKDLAIRGPGEFLGHSQTGMPDLAMKALNNIELVKLARETARAILARDPYLKSAPLLNERLAAFRHAVHLE